MDDIKDIQKTDSVSRYFDDATIKTNPFGENRAADRAYRRAERIVAAVYLLTNHVPESESIRASVRTAAQGLLAAILDMRDEMRSPQSRSVHALQSGIRHLISLVRILNVSGSISSQNASTMIEALDELGNFLVASQRSVLSENVTITRDELVDVHSASIFPKASSRSHLASSAVKDTKSSAANGAVSDTGQGVNGAGDTSVRIQSILDILAAGGSLGIKDIAANLPEYSEKMIQRELLDLTNKGRIQKVGLKRWSKYTLVR